MFFLACGRENNVLIIFGIYLRKYHYSEVRINFAMFTLRAATRGRAGAYIINIRKFSGNLLLLDFLGFLDAQMINRKPKLHFCSKIFLDSPGATHKTRGQKFFSC